MKKKKIISNEHLLKEIEKLQEQLAQKQIVPFIPYTPPVTICPGHTHCTCQHCHPLPYTPWPLISQPFYIASTGSSTGTSHISNGGLKIG